MSESTREELLALADEIEAQSIPTMSDLALSRNERVAIIAALRLAAKPDVYVDAFRREEARADKLGREVDDLRAQLREMVDMVAPTLKSEHRLSQGLSSALIRSRAALAPEQDK